MASKRQHELPDQDIDEIRECVLAEADEYGHVADADLFVDPYFPPDQSVLNFVYSGDDKYERMVFRRPRDLCVSPTFCGVGGACFVRLPWKPWNDRSWFLYALATVSLNPYYMKKILPGYTSFEQSFSKNYCGAFLVQLWRFGDWVEVVIDDNLPVLDGGLAYCSLFGTPPEVWGALIEKAYAKSHRVYEAIEIGNPLNALVDLTGSVCEHYSTNRINSRLFHIIYKSCINRSMQVCWRHLRSTKDAGFSAPPDVSKCEMDDADDREKCKDINDHGPNQLFLITAASKFPMRDGSLLEVLRLKDPYRRLHKLWIGEFSAGHPSWNRVNPAFLENYRPKECREPDEFWVSYADFCVHFGDVVVCSDTAPYQGLDADAERRYKGEEADAFTSLDTVSGFPGFDSFAAAAGVDANGKRPSSCPESKEPAGWRFGKPGSAPSSFKRRSKRSNNIAITVREGRGTVKVDNVAGGGGDAAGKERESGRSRARKCKGSEAKYLAPSDDEAERHSVGTPATARRARYEHSMSFPRADAAPPRASSMSATLQRVCRRKGSASAGSSPFSELHLSDLEGEYHADLVHNIGSHRPGAAREQHAGGGNIDNGVIGVNACVSEVAISVANKDKVVQRANSEPIASRTGSYSSQTSIFESRMDYFRSRGAWRDLVKHSGKWKKSTAGGPRFNMQLHSKNPRVAFVIGRGDAVNEITPAGMQGKAHVLVSLLQDYRQGPRNINCMLVSIGICLYKARSLDRDERKPLSKLTLIDDIRSEGEAREVTARFDLEPGVYFLVPYTSEVGQVGEFFLRVLAEKDEIAGKTTCSIS